MSLQVLWLYLQTKDSDNLTHEAGIELPTIEQKKCEYYCKVTRPDFGINLFNRVLFGIVTGRGAYSLNTHFKFSRILENVNLTYIC